MSEGDVDAMIERMAREEQDDLEREHGRQILDLMTARSDKDPFIELLNRAHQAKASEGEADQQ